MNERILQRNIIEEIRKLYPKILIYNTNDRIQVGIPDLLLCKDGKFIGIELKVTKNDSNHLKALFLPKRRQLIEMWKIENSGGIAYGLIYFVKHSTFFAFRLKRYNFDEEYLQRLYDLKVAGIMDDMSFNIKEEFSRSFFGEYNFGIEKGHNVSRFLERILEDEFTPSEPKKKFEVS